MNSAPRTGAAIPLRDMALCRVEGADATGFLHAQLAADVASLQAGEAAFAAYCSPRGQVVALLLLRRRESDWLLAGNDRLLPPVIDRLRRFVLRSDVSFDAAPGCLAGIPQDAIDVATDLIAPRGTDLRYTVLETTGESGNADDLSAWRWRELLRGVLWLQPETSERFIPQMLGLERLDAVSFRKGCYPGQEIVARAKHLGQVKRRPVLVECEAGEVPAAGSECSLYRGDQAAQGTVVDAVSRPDKQTLVVVVTALDPEAAVDGIDPGSGRIDCRRRPFAADIPVP